MLFTKELLTGWWANMAKRKIREPSKKDLERVAKIVVDFEQAIQKERRKRVTLRERLRGMFTP